MFCTANVDTRFTAYQACRLEAKHMTYQGGLVHIAHGTRMNPKMGHGTSTGMLL